MLKFLLTLIIVFFVFRLLGRFFIVRTFDNMQKRQSPPPPQHRPEGEVRIEGNGKNRGRSGSEGEYVDYEEVK